MMDEFDMESYIDKRMLEIQGMEERIAYKNIVGDLLKKINEYNKQSYKELEYKILNESSTSRSDYAVYITMTDMAHYDATDQYMHAMDMESTKKSKVSYDEVCAAVKENVPLKLYTVFVKTNVSAIYKILNAKRIFHGLIKTENREYKGTFILKKNEKYLDMIRDLYYIFTINYQSWITVCEAYLTKMLDVYLLETEEMGEGEEIREIYVDFEEYEELIYRDMIPLWNLKKIREKTSTYPDAAIDKINYEHQIFSHRLNSECEYLIINTDVEIINIRRINGDLMITCPVDKPKEWELYQVNKVPQNKNYLYPILSNQYKESFFGNVTEMFRKSIKTKAEMARLIEAFPYQKDIKFCDFKIVEDIPKELEMSNYNMDGFIQDEIRVGKCRQILLLSFDAAEQENYLNEDIMSFLVTQVQKIFPEYQCMGKFV